MGKTILGSQGSSNLLSPEQQNYLSQAMQGQGAYGQFLQPYSPEAYSDVFERGVLQPTQKAYTQKILPAIQQRFVDAGGGSSSALNQALAQSASDLQSTLGSQYLDFFKGQQQNTLGALGQLGNLSGSRSFEPYQQQGILGDIIKALASLGIAASSEKIKENIREYSHGLDKLNKLDVKMYDYKKEYADIKDTVGLIAENIPHEFQSEINGIKAVNVYGIVGLLINSVKELSGKVAILEKK